MITSIEITGLNNYSLDDTTKKYVNKKIGRLDRYLPRHARASVTVEVKLKEVNQDHGNKYEAEVMLNVPDKMITAKDTTLNMLAAVDIVEAKIIAQLRRYKQATVGHIGRRSAMSRFKRGYAREL
jgi:putative sigma-54 modulation protein